MPHDDEIHDTRNWTVVFHAGMSTLTIPIISVENCITKEFHFVWSGFFPSHFPFLFNIASPEFHHPFWLFAVRRPKNDKTLSIV